MKNIWASVLVPIEIGFEVEDDFVQNEDNILEAACAQLQNAWDNNALGLEFSKFSDPHDLGITLSGYDDLTDSPVPCLKDEE